MAFPASNLWQARFSSRSTDPHVTGSSPWCILMKLCRFAGSAKVDCSLLPLSVSLRALFAAIEVALYVFLKLFQSRSTVSRHSNSTAERLCQIREFTFAISLCSSHQLRRSDLDWRKGRGRLEISIIYTIKEDIYITSAARGQSDLA